MVTARHAPALVVAALALASCGTVAMGEEAALRSATQAVEDAGIDASTTVEPAAGGEDWLVTVALPTGDITGVLDASSGRFTSLDVAAGVEVDDGRIAALARHAANPDDDDARSRRTVVVLALLAAAVAGGLVLARRARLAEEASLAEAAADDPMPSSDRD